MEKGRAGSPRAGCLPLAELGVLLLRHVFHSIRAEQDVFRTGRVAARRRAIRYQPRGQERRGEDRPVSKPLTAARELPSASRAVWSTTSQAWCSTIRASPSAQS